MLLFLQKAMGEDCYKPPPLVTFPAGFPKCGHVTIHGGEGHHNVLQWPDVHRGKGKDRLPEQN